MKRKAAAVVADDRDENVQYLLIVFFVAFFNLLGSMSLLVRNERYLIMISRKKLIKQKSKGNWVWCSSLKRKWSYKNLKGLYLLKGFIKCLLTYI